VGLRVGIGVEAASYIVDNDDLYQTSLVPLCNCGQLLNYSNVYFS
jgi:hypothetical protein